MTTYSDNTAYTNNTVEGYRIAGLEYGNILSSIGLVKTADTGQIDWATVAKPTAGQQNAGYEIWRLDDALQATAPIFIRIEWRTAPESASTAYANNTFMTIGVGKGSDGAGNLTGVLCVPQYMVHQNYGTYSDTGAIRSSYAAAVNGAYWVAFKVGSANTNCFYLNRWVDSTGNPTGDGVTLYAANRSSSAFNSYHASYDELFYYGVGSGQACFIPGGYTANILGDPQIFPHFAITPVAIAQVGALTIPSALVALAGTIAATPAGSVEHTYISMGYEFGYGAQNTGYIALIWE